MRLFHLGLAISIVAIWGFNFVVIHVGLKEISPLGLSFARFFLASLPAIFFVKRPAISMKLIVLYGLIMFAIHITLLFMGMKEGLTAGLASLLMQVHIFFTIFFAALLLGERPSRWQIVGGLMAISGMTVIGAHSTLGTAPLLGFVFVIAAAAFWGVGNLIVKRFGKINMLGLVVWGSFVAWPPLLVISLTLEGTKSIVYSFHHLSWFSIVAVSYIVYLSTWFGLGCWNWLLSKYPVTTIAPFTLLVPIFAMLSSVILLGEPLESWKLIACMFVCSGLFINLLGPSLHAKRNQTKQEDLGLQEVDDRL